MPVTPNLGLNIPSNGTQNWDTLLNYNFSLLDTLYGNLPVLQSLYDETAQSANISSTPWFSPAQSGRFKISGYIIVTTAATSSSTLPSIVISWTDADNATVQTLTLTATNAGNLLTTFAQASAMISVAGGTTVSISTSSYASSGATAMQFALHARAEAVQ